MRKQKPDGKKFIKAIIFLTLVMFVTFVSFAAVWEFIVKPQQRDFPATLPDGRNFELLGYIPGEKFDVFHIRIEDQKLLIFEFADKSLVYNVKY